MKNRIFLISTLLFLGVSNSFSQVFSAPILEAVGLDQAVSLRWDSLSETSAATFTGYRLYRARLQNGPFLLLRTWKKSSITSITRMFYDIGYDDGSGTLTGTEGIRNEVSYYYKLTAFADSTFDPPNPYLESSSSIEYVVPHTQPIGYAVNTITMISTSGIQGDIGIPLITVTNRSNFRSLFEEHPFSIVLNTINTWSGMFISFIIKDTVSGLVQSTVFNPNVTLLGDTITGSKSGEFSLKNVFGMNAFDVSMNWRFEQLAKPITLDTVILFTGNPLTNTPVLFRDTLKTHYVGLINLTNTLGEATYEIEFLTGGIDTFDVSQKQVYQYLNMKITDKKTGRILESKPITSTGDIIPLNKWATITYAFNMKLQAPLPYIKPGINKYYLPTEIDTATSWEFSNMILVEGARIVCDYAAKGGQIGRRWPNPGYKVTCDF